jgi:D-glycero-alpha-D-manno-heptose-7-phosphate kinase
MLIVRSPLRISLAGGGTDLPAYYREYGGAVINVAIDRYFYVFLRTLNSNGLDIASADFRMFFRHNGDYPLSWEGDLELPRAIFHHFGIVNGVRLFIASEVPPGTGLGSSSSVSVGLTKALSTACNLNWTPKEIAELASYIEITKLGSPIGKQDQYAAAFGGINLIEFRANETNVTPLKLHSGVYRNLVNSLMLFYTGQSRNANDILSKQQKATEKKSGPALEALHRVKSMVPLVQKCLETGDIIGLGGFMHENWMEKKKFANGVSNSRIDECYEAARAAGAYGGKITGAGGGGFLLICCDEPKREQIAAVLEEMGLVRIGFNFDDLGARVIMNSGLLLTSHSKWEKPKELLLGTV